MAAVHVLEGDCREVMASMPASSFDAIVTDPPYDLLSVSRNGSRRINVGQAGNPYAGGAARAGGFMGQAWDATGVAFNPETWRVAMRVLKPGGHLLAFGGTRTFHRLTCAIEDAGFEIRDCLSWLYGSGFPKSLDVSKSIDKAAGMEREVTGPGRRHGGGSNGVYAQDAWTKEHHGDVAPITAPASEAAQQWQGWGTALKPAWEPIILARKPLAGTVAQNVQQFGTGAINVDKCRIEGPPLTINKLERWSGFGQVERPDYTSTTSTAGRWPANVCLDGEAAEILDQQSGERRANWTDADNRRSMLGYQGGSKGIGAHHYSDTGGASRFFYTAKASGSERNERLRQVGERNTHPTVKPLDLMRWLVRLVTPPGGHLLDPFAGSGTTLVAALMEGFQATAIERDPDYVRLMRARIDGVQTGGFW